MIKCQCGEIQYGPLEARTLLNISGATLNKYREEGWIKASYHSVGYLYRRKDLEELQLELNRRKKSVITEVRHDATS